MGESHDDAHTSPTPPDGEALTDEERRLLDEALGGVQRLRRPGRARPWRPAPPPEPAQRLADEAAALREAMEADPDTFEDTGDELLWQAPGLSAGDFRKLRRGTFAVQAVIDLHGLGREQARSVLAAFLDEARDADLRCVKVIHGKGLRSSAAGPVLKPAVARWLRRRKDVLGYTSAKAVDGGTGAAIVLLRRR